MTLMLNCPPASELFVAETLEWTAVPGVSSAKGADWVVTAKLAACPLASVMLVDWPEGIPVRLTLNDAEDTDPGAAEALAAQRAYVP